VVPFDDECSVLKFREDFGDYFSTIALTETTYCICFTDSHQIYPRILSQGRARTRSDTAICDKERYMGDSTCKHLVTISTGLYVIRSKTPYLEHEEGKEHGEEYMRTPLSEETLLSMIH
jgi:hypothetical protein